MDRSIDENEHVCTAAAAVEMLEEGYDSGGMA
jgi:hypothetical protein